MMDSNTHGGVSVGKAGKERKRTERATTEQKRVEQYIKSGGAVNCGSCVNGWRCPCEEENLCGMWRLR